MSFIFLRFDGLNKRFAFSEILYVEGYKNYIHIYTVKNRFILHYSLRQMEENLPSDMFCRIHKSYIVALDKITEYDCNTVHINSTELPMSSSFAHKIRLRLPVIVSNKSPFTIKRSV